MGNYEDYVSGAASIVSLCLFENGRLSYVLSRHSLMLVRLSDFWLFFFDLSPLTVGPMSFWTWWSFSALIALRMIVQKLQHPSCLGWCLGFSGLFYIHICSVVGGLSTGRFLWARYPVKSSHRLTEWCVWTNVFALQKKGVHDGNPSPLEDVIVGDFPLPISFRACQWQRIWKDLSFRSVSPSYNY